jgi:hypothetical protein
VSGQGLRVATTCQLPSGAAIRCQLEGNGSPGLEGLGSEEWCQHVVNRSFFEMSVALFDQIETVVPCACLT